ncbi:hypothetical protein ALC60_04588, partial [Trachymyrmex zeteki]
VLASGDNRGTTLHHFRPSYFLSKFPSRPRWITNAAKTSHSSVMTRAHHYRIITPVTRSVMLRGNDRAGISASWKGQRIVFRRRGGRRYRTGMTCRSRRNDPEHARNDEASFLASPPFDRGYYREAAASLPTTTTTTTTDEKSIVYLSMCDIRGVIASISYELKARCGLATGQDELRGQSFWENFSKMQEVAATATKHMRDL